MYYFRGAFYDKTMVLSTSILLFAGIFHDYICTHCVNHSFNQPIVQKEAENANKTYALHIMQSVDYTLKTIDEYVIKELQTNQRIDQFFDNKLEGNPYYSAYEVTELIRG